MHMSRRSGFLLIVAILALLMPASTEGGRGNGPAAPPTIIALVEPPDGAVISPGDRPTFAFEATPGGRFRVEFSSSNAPFIPTLTSGRRTTPGDQFKPSMNQWRMISGLAGPSNTVYWRVVALQMNPSEIAAVPVSSFTLGA